MWDIQRRTLVVCQALDSEIELVPIHTVVASGNDVVRTLAGGVESCTVSIVLHQLSHFALIIDPMQRSSCASVHVTQGLLCDQTSFHASYRQASPVFG